jgi:hypothetical protein
VHKQNSEAEYKTRMTKEREMKFISPLPPPPKKELEFGTRIQELEPEKRGKKINYCNY